MKSVVLAIVGLVLTSTIGSRVAFAQPSATPPAKAATLPTLPARIVETPLEKHLGVEGWLSGGLLLALGGSVHYEQGVIGETTWIVRFETVLGLPLEEGAERMSFALQTGGRVYAGSFYVAGELGIAALRVDGYDDGVGKPSFLHYDLWPSGRIGIGAHGSDNHLDIGLAIGVPAFGIGVHLGFDFAWW